jgi:predicted CopG family antitoxin
MARDADKHIRVTEETWKELNRRKEPGDSFEDVLERLLEERSEGNPSRMTPTTAD